jgi:PAS domain S-box-containing protein
LVLRVIKKEHEKFKEKSGEIMKRVKSIFWLYLAYFYGAFGILWIFFSDHLLNIWSLTATQLQVYSFIKGTLFVLLTTCLFFYIGKKQKDHDQLKQEKEKLDMLINAMPDFVVFKDHESRWRQANEIAVKLYEIENVDYKGKRDSELALYTEFFRETLIKCGKTDELTWQSKDISRNLVKVPMRNGSYKCFDEIKIPMFHTDGSRKGILVIGRDISDLKKTEEILLKKEKLIVVGELAAGIAHEIRNPLTTMKGFLQLVKEKNISIDSCQDLLIQEIERINEIVNELLMLAKPQLQPFEEASVIDVIHNTINLMTTEANLNNVTLSLKVENDFTVSC